MERVGREMGWMGRMVEVEGGFERRWRGGRWLEWRRRVWWC